MSREECTKVSMNDTFGTRSQKPDVSREDDQADKTRVCRMCRINIVFPSPGYNGFNSRDADRDVTVTAPFPGGFEKYYDKRMVLPWAIHSPYLHTNQPLRSDKRGRVCH